MEQFADDPTPQVVDKSPSGCSNAPWSRFSTFPCPACSVVGGESVEVVQTIYQQRFERVDELIVDDTVPQILEEFDMVESLIPCGRMQERTASARRQGEHRISVMTRRHDYRRGALTASPAKCVAALIPRTTRIKRSRTRQMLFIDDRCVKKKGEHLRSEVAA